MFKKGCIGSQFGFLISLIILVSSVFWSEATKAICSPKEVPTPIPEPL